MTGDQRLGLTTVVDSSNMLRNETPSPEKESKSPYTWQAMAPKMKIRNSSTIRTFATILATLLMASRAFLDRVDAQKTTTGLKTDVHSLLSRTLSVPTVIRVSTANARKNIAVRLSLVLRLLRFPSACLSPRLPPTSSSAAENSRDDAAVGLSGAPLPPTIHINSRSAK